MKTTMALICTVCGSECDEFDADGECIHEDCADACGDGAPDVDPDDEEEGDDAE